MADDGYRQVDLSRRVQAALDVLRGYAAARERQRKPVPAELRAAIAQFGSDLEDARSMAARERAPSTRLRPRPPSRSGA